MVVTYQPGPSCSPPVSPSLPPTPSSDHPLTSEPLLISSPPPMAGSLLFLGDYALHFSLLLLSGRQDAMSSPSSPGASSTSSAGSQLSAPPCPPHALPFSALLSPLSTVYCFPSALEMDSALMERASTRALISAGHLHVSRDVQPLSLSSSYPGARFQHVVLSVLLDPNEVNLRDVVVQLFNSAAEVMVEDGVLRLVLSALRDEGWVGEVQAKGLEAGFTLVRREGVVTEGQERVEEGGARGQRPS